MTGEKEKERDCGLVVHSRHAGLLLLLVLGILLHIALLPNK